MKFEGILLGDLWSFELRPDELEEFVTCLAAVVEAAQHGRSYHV